MLQSNQPAHFSIDHHNHNGPGHQMNITEIHTPMASLKHGTYTAEADFHHSVLPTKDTILSCSYLQGSSLTVNHENLDIREQGSLLFQEQAVPYEHIMKANKNQQGEFLEIAVSKSFITQLFAEEKAYLAELLEQDAPAFSLDLNLATLQVVQQLIANPYQGKLAVHYLHNKMEELHLLHYHNWNCSKQPKPIALHQKDKEALYDIKRYITTHYNQDFTIQELAYQAGINPTKLKQGFKALFGTTTFKYLHDLRMQKAVELIQSKAYAIYEIAEFVGYRHSHHFTAAFKKHYGKLPTQVK